MPIPSTKKGIAIKISDAGANDSVKIQNETQGWITRVQCNSNGEALYNPAKDDNSVAASDTINVYLNGRVVGNGTGTISGGGVTITITGTVDTISQAVNL